MHVLIELFISQVLTSSPASCQVKNINVLGQFEKNGDLLHRCTGNVPKWLVAENGVLQCDAV